MARSRERWFGLERPLRYLASFAVAAGLAVLVFLILPLLEQITQPKGEDSVIRAVDTANLPPPPPPPPEEPKEEQKEEEPPPPELAEEAPPLDLSQLELALNPGMGGDGFGGDFAVKLPLAGGGKDDGDETDAIFSVADLDQAPRVVYQPAPDYPAELKKKKIAGTVYILFLVDMAGRVVNPIVQKSTQPAFDQPALQAVRKWRFEPGKRAGKAVQFKMRVPITFSAG
jgi:protein TonB